MSSLSPATFCEDVSNCKYGLVLVLVVVVVEVS